MNDICSIAAVREALKARGLSPNKKLGQNFLCDENIIKKIAEAAGVTEGDSVLEIGPGLGALTAELCQRAERVVAVEIDSGLADALGEAFSGKPNVEIVHADFLKCDLAGLHKKLGGGPFRVAANLPYYITTAIVMRLLESDLPIVSMSFLVQKEVAERMAALPGTKSYGSLSIAVQYYTDISVALSVPRGCFFPPPAVDSVVVRMNVRPPKVKVVSEREFFRITRCAFAMRRKTLVNNLVAGLGLKREEAESMTARAKLPADVRGEALSLIQFAALADEYAHRDN